jgi:hypothetical protein
MTEQLSFHGAEHSTAKRARWSAKRPGLGLPPQGTPRRKNVPGLVRVPMLDWPRNLFSDNVSVLEVMAEDFPLKWEIPAYPGLQSPKIFIQAAA